MICRVVIGYFDGELACDRKTRVIVPTEPLDVEKVARLQATCDELFGMQLQLLNHLTTDGLLCIEDVGIRPDTHRAACTAHELFGMSVIDHAHRSIIFPAPERQPINCEQLLSICRTLGLNRDEPEIEAIARELQQKYEFERKVREQVQSSAVTWRGRV